jgi:predicted RNA-binding protein with PIN domain
MPYLVDGNNLLGSWKGARANDDGRAEVVRRVAAFCRARGARAIIVFDGAPLRADLDRQTLGAVEIRTPPRGKDADSMIREIVDRPDAAKEIIVVTSDRPLYSYAKTRGASVLRAHEWNALESQARHGAPKHRRHATDSEKPDREPDVEYWLQRFTGRTKHS